MTLAFSLSFLVLFSPWTAPRHFTQGPMGYLIYQVRVTLEDRPLRAILLQQSKCAAV